jgi:type II secretory pathway pseudopilin PulG
MRERGFTILEMVILVVVIMASTALVYPVVTSEIMRANRAKAVEQCRLIAVGVEKYLHDKALTTHRFPTDPVTGKRFHWLRGPGNLPANNSFSDGEPHGRLERLLLRREKGNKAWNGPYVDVIEPDPWGNAYLMNSEALFNDKERKWILSAGPNGVVDTSAESPETRGDDIGRILP